MSNVDIDPDICVICEAPATGRATINGDTYCYDSTLDCCYRRALDLIGSSNVYALFVVGDSISAYTLVPSTERRADVPCRVYFGTHGCSKERGHRGPHECSSGHEDEPYRPGLNYGEWWKGYYHLYGEDVSLRERICMKITEPLGWVSRWRHRRHLNRR